MASNYFTRSRKRRSAVEKAPEVQPEEGTSSKRAKLEDGSASTSSPPRNVLLDEVAKALEVMSAGSEMENFEEAPPEMVDSTREVLVKVPQAEVQLLEQGMDTDVQLASGELEITRIVQSGTTAAVFLKVGDSFQWPLASDAPVVKLDDLHYIFTLKVHVSLEDDQTDDKAEEHPTKADVLTYGLTFPEGTDKELLNLLDTLTERYSYLVKLQGEQPQVQPLPGEEQDVSVVEPSKTASKSNNIWWFNQSVPNFQHEYRSSLARAIALGSSQIVQGILWASELLSNQIERSGFLVTKNIKPTQKPSKFSSQTLKNIEKAKKLSKMSSSIAENLLTGVVTATGSITSTVMNTQAGKAFLGMLPGEAALATLDAFVRVFEALEMAGKNVLSRTSLVTCQVVSHRFGDQAGAVAKQSLATAGHVITTAWTISKIRTAIDPRNAHKSSILLKATAQELSKQTV